jgi:C_GCAxxG_C_C family probable redox protein
MWEAYGLDNPDVLWAGTVFRGGIGGEQQAPCGAISGGAIALGLRHRVDTDDEEKAEAAREAASRDAAALVADFRKRFGDITCRGLLGVDLVDEAAAKRAHEAGIFERCDEHVKWVIAWLYELEEKRPG